MNPTLRPALVGVLGLALCWFALSPIQAQEVFPKELPKDVVFKGEAIFHQLVKRAQEEKWAELPLPERIVTVGKAMLDTPYENYTLEIDDKVEAASANLTEMDCWTFFEQALGFARMLKSRAGKEMRPRDLLYQVQQDRYRGGLCTGEYLSRIHYLIEWYEDNEARGLLKNITKDIGGEHIGYRQCTEMTKLWKHYRYLKHTPALLPSMAASQERIEKLRVYYIPKERVASIEPKLQNGDVIGITGYGKQGYCSHVGLAYRGKDGTLHFMHATSTKSKGRKVIIDERLFVYLRKHRRASGIIVGRPIEVTHDPSYEYDQPHPVAVAAAREHAAAFKLTDLKKLEGFVPVDGPPGSANVARVVRISAEVGKDQANGQNSHAEATEASPSPGLQFRGPAGRDVSIQATE